MTRHKGRAKALWDRRRLHRYRIAIDFGIVIRNCLEPGMAHGPGRLLARRARARLRDLGVKVTMARDTTPLCRVDCAIQTFYVLLDAMLDGLPANLPSEDAPRWIQNRLHDAERNGLKLEIKGLAV